jgi:hypothetical protein
MQQRASTLEQRLRSRLVLERLEDRLVPSTMSTQILQPNTNAIVNGTYLIKAKNTDSNSITSVQFYLDGSAIGPLITSGSWQYYWDTTTTTDGSHNLSDVATDSKGNTLQSALLPIQVNNNDAQVGTWGPIMSMPIVAVNMVLLHTGNILYFQGNGTLAQVLNPTTGVSTAVPNNYTNLFCAGQAQLFDGRILVTGGYGNMNQGVPNVNIFDPIANTWTEAADMAYPRWYPTVTGLPDGEMMTLGGANSTDTDYVPYQETYNPSTGVWTTLTNAPNTSLPSYPNTYVLSNGNLVTAAASEVSIPTDELNPATQTWTTVDPNVVDGASSTMFLPDQIIKVGTASNSGGTKNAKATTYYLNMDAANPHWQQLANMNYPRATTVNLVTMPDGNVVVLGGGTNTNGADLAKAVFPAEEWSPLTQTWTEMSSMEVPRLYHSTSLLLPDGRILESGSGGDVGPNQMNYQIYSPNYLFKGARPTIGSSPTNLQYANSFFVGTPDAANISSVVLIRPGAVTHGFDQDQRFVPLTFSQTTGGLTVQAPANSNLAPPGYYMLFIVNSSGVPSVANFVQLPASVADTQPPTVPGNLTAISMVGGSSLAWAASTDNWALNGYQVYRSTNPNFVASPATQIGTTTATTYFDVVAPGTYYYLVTASDFTGNISAASNEASATPTLDTTPPAVSMTGWTTGANVFGTIAVQAAATDNVSVAGVQFLLDGSNLGTEVTTAPYYYNWNTAGVANGSHTLSAIAFDAAGNQAQATSITVNVNNTSSTSGLVAAYAFDEGSGTTVADSSANGLTGTIANATWTTVGKYGNALAFNGTNAVVTVNDAPVLHLTNSLTLEAWVYRTWTDVNTWQTVIFKNRPDDASYALQGTDPNVYSPASAFIYTGGPQDATAYGGGFVSKNQWTFLAMTYDGKHLKLYKNGKQVGTVAASGSILETTDALQFGGNSVWSDEFLSGTLDNIRIYSIALTAAQITQDMNTPVGPPPASPHLQGADLAPAEVSALPAPLAEPLPVIGNSTSLGVLADWSNDWESNGARRHGTLPAYDSTSDGVPARKPESASIDAYFSGMTGLSDPFGAGVG